MERGGGAATMQGLRERLRDAWEELDDDDIERSGGSLEKLAELLSRKTGRPRADVRRELRRLFAG
jgi:hypothetical protein